ncbi:hypothetical protein [Pseudonocardia sp.]|uniref:hypothetical protein n=1 Tax=Pseudonocardia sp. TaxID=60912 RepID=UPI003D1230B4
MPAKTQPPDLATATERATAATEAARTLRDRIADGDGSVTAAALAKAEADERHAALTRDAAQRRHDQDQAAADAAKLHADRASVQDEWTRSRTPDAVADLHRLREDAVQAAARYLDAAEARLRYLENLAVRAATLGFHVDLPRNPGHTPTAELVAGLREAVRAVHPWADTLVPGVQAQPLDPTRSVT